MSGFEHVELLIDRKSGKPRKEPVHARRLENGHLVLLHSPGFVLGIAADDEFRLLSTDGDFVVERRGGNIAVQVYADHDLDGVSPILSRSVMTLGGHLDGSIPRGLVYTIPASCGFEAIESLFNGFTRSNPGTEWFYGNVHDPEDGVTPLRWWEDRSKP